jgi:hypothetical protein
MHTKVSLEKLKVKKSFGKPGFAMRIILKLISKNYGVKVWTGFIVQDIMQWWDLENMRR